MDRRGRGAVGLAGGGGQIASLKSQRPGTHGGKERAECQAECADGEIQVCEVVRKPRLCPGHQCFGIGHDGQGENGHGQQQNATEQQVRDAGQDEQQKVGAAVSFAFFPGPGGQVAQRMPCEHPSVSSDGREHI